MSALLFYCLRTVVINKITFRRLGPAVVDDDDQARVIVNENQFAFLLSFECLLIV